MKVTTPFFSIIVVCYNAGEELHKTVQSIQKQTDGDYEIIVKDGASTDGSLKQLQEDDRLRIYSSPDKGIYDAMNQAVSYMNGRYALFLNCGDYFYDDRVLETVHRAILENTVSKKEQPAVYYGNTFERKTGNVVNSNPKLDAFGCYRNVPCHQCCFYPAGYLKPQELEKRGRERTFCLKYRVRADYEHFLWCFFEQKAKAVYIPVTVCSYEGGGFSETAENRKCSAKEHKEITALYMTPQMRFRYRAIMMLTLAPLRTKLAESKRFSALYQKIKKKLYRG